MDIQFGHTVYGMHEKGLRRVVPHLCFVFVSSQSLLVLYPRPVFHPDFREKRVQFKQLMREGWFLNRLGETHPLLIFTKKKKTYKRLADRRKTVDKLKILKVADSHHPLKDSRDVLEYFLVSLTLSEYGTTLPGGLNFSQASFCKFQTSKNQLFQTDQTSILFTETR